MRNLFLLAFMLFTTSIFSQETTTSKWAIHDSLEALIKVDKQGKGNGTFSLSKLTSIVKSKTLKGLQDQLGTWNSNAADNKLGYEWNDKTKDHDIPNYQVTYESTIAKKFYTIDAEVPVKLEGVIKKLTVTVELNGMELAQFKKSLQNAGYLLNENLTQIYKKQAWQKKGSPMITIRKNANGTVSIGAF